VSSVACQFHLRLPTAWQEAQKMSELNITNRISFPIHDYTRQEVGTATCHFAESSLYSSEQRKSEALPLDLRIRAMKFSASTAFLRNYPKKNSGN